ncbi:FkbM family methyltransferase [Candidatus Pelagibacter ubique]|nr:FkbM family methyltransferase [Candidatus Pelagibacter ubique]
MKNFIDKIYNRIKIITLLIFDPYVNLYWSQEGEDILLKRIFENKKKGFYIDVGAHHSTRFSNTYKLYKEDGWCGINIDPNEDSYNNLKKNRKRDININCGISDKDEYLKFYCFKENALNTFSVKKKNQLKKNLLVKKKISVICKRLDNLLDSHIKKSLNIDLLTIDAEGYDLKVLKSNNWNKYRPTYIIVEIASETISEIFKHPIYHFLIKKNYDIYSKLNKSVIFKTSHF